MLILFYNNMNTPKKPETQSDPEQNEQERVQKISYLNDQLRIMGQGGQIVATQGFSALPQETQQTAVQMIRGFSTFTPDNDPYKEHDFGSVEVQGQKIFWKIDYYDQSMQYQSPDPTNPNVTNRVMTIMLASEY